MQTPFTFYKPKMHSHGSKFNIVKDSIKISHRQIYSINSDKSKNVTTRSVSRLQMQEEVENQQGQNESIIRKDLLDRIHIKSESENVLPNSTQSTPKKHKSFSSYVSRIIGNRKHQKEFKAYRSLGKNIKEMKVEKCITQVGINKNSSSNNKEQIKNTSKNFSQSKYEAFPDFKGSLIVLGIKKRKEAKLKAEEQELMAQSIDMPHVISGWNTKYSPPKKFHNVILEKIYKNEWTYYSPEIQQKTDEELIQFVKSSKLSLKKRPSFLQQKLNKSLIN